jgi:hypothetical protein
VLHQLVARRRLVHTHLEDHVAVKVHRVQGERRGVVELLELLQVAVLVHELARVEADHPRGRLFGEERWRKKSGCIYVPASPGRFGSVGQVDDVQKMCVGLE